MDVDSPPTTRTTPHLLKIYVKPSSFHPSSLFYETKSVPTEDQYELFCWEETTLQGIVQGLVGIVPEKFRAHQGNWSFRLVSEEDSRGGRGTWKEKDLGVVSLKDLEGREAGSDESLLSLAILPQSSDPIPLYLLCSIQNLPVIPFNQFPHSVAQPFTSSSGGDRVYSNSGGVSRLSDGGPRAGMGGAPPGGASFGWNEASGGPRGAPAFGAPRGGGGDWSRGGGHLGAGAGGRDASTSWGAARGGGFGGGMFGAAMKGATDNGHAKRGGRAGPPVGYGARGGGAGGREPERRRRSPSY